MNAFISFRFLRGGFTPIRFDVGLHPADEVEAWNTANPWTSFGSKQRVRGWRRFG